MATPINVYPLSNNGVSIPLDVARPKNCLVIPITTSKLLAILSTTVEDLVCSITCTKDTLIAFGDVSITPSGYKYTDTFYCQANVQYDLILPNQVSIKAVSSAGTCIINIVERWAQLANATSYEVS